MSHQLEIQLEMTQVIKQLFTFLTEGEGVSWFTSDTNQSSVYRFAITIIEAGEKLKSLIEKPTSTAQYHVRVALCESRNVEQSPGRKINSVREGRTGF
jgi:hypothetical protein